MPAWRLLFWFGRGERISGRLGRLPMVYGAPAKTLRRYAQEYLQLIFPHGKY
jgi:hypothetical protein